MNRLLRGVSARHVLHMTVWAMACLYGGASLGQDADVIMQESLARHQKSPYIYEEQTMVLTSAGGQHDTRRLRLFSRMDEAGLVTTLLLFEHPEEIRGVAVLSTGDHQGDWHSQLYLPAYGPQLISSNLSHRADQSMQNKFLGTDFMVNDLLPEPLEQYRYRLLSEETMDQVDYWVIEGVPKVEHPHAGYLRRHYVRKDNYYIVRTDTINHLGQLIRQKSAHDLKPLGGALWSANMVLMRDLTSRHQTLIKVDRRVFSKDYVPAELFSLQWLSENQGAPPKPDEASTDTFSSSGAE